MDSRTAAKNVWHGIVEGRLVIEKHFDKGGRRHLVVRPAAGDGAERALTERERQVVAYRAYGQTMKRIALELGLSVPTVARTLGSALGKLGLASDVELPAVFGAGLRDGE
jgi:DNA-binding CsgD family transcriptional regulator